jgi:uncharacterized protein (DUF433 family)
MRDKQILELDDLITSNADILGGRLVFRGTRVPVETLFENLAGGMSLNQILNSFPTLDRADFVRVLELTPLWLFPEDEGLRRNR